MPPENNGNLNVTSDDVEFRKRTCDHPQFALAGEVRQHQLQQHIPSGQQILSDVVVGYRFFCTYCLLVKQTRLG